MHAASHIGQLGNTLVENKCILCKDLARSLQNTHYLQDLARTIFLARSYKEVFSLEDLARKCFS